MFKILLPHTHSNFRSTRVFCRHPISNLVLPSSYKANLAIRIRLAHSHTVAHVVSFSYDCKQRTPLCTDYAFIAFKPYKWRPCQDITRFPSSLCVCSSSLQLNSPSAFDPNPASSINCITSHRCQRIPITTDGTVPSSIPCTMTRTVQMLPDTSLDIKIFHYTLV